MSNPFDQFGTDMSYGAPPAAPAGGDPNNPFSFGPPAPAPAPVASFDSLMPPPAQTSSMMGYSSPPPSMSMSMSQQLPPMAGNGYGMQSQQQQSQPPMPMNGGIMGGPPAPSSGMLGGMPMGGMAPVAPAAGDPYASYGAPPPSFEQPSMYGAPPPEPFSYGAPPPAAPPTSDPFSSFGAPALAPSMQAAPPTPNRYGAAPPGPPPQQAPPMAPATPNPYGAPPPPAPFVSSMASMPSVDPFAAYGAPPVAPAPPQQYQQQPPPPTFGAPPPSMMSDPFGGYGAPPPPAAQQATAPAPAPVSDPFGGYGGYGGPPPPAQGGYGGPPPPAQIGYGDPFGGQPEYGALVVSQQQSNPYAMPMVQQQQQQQPPAAVDPFSVFNQAPAPPPQPQQSYAMVPAHQPPPQMVQVSSSTGDVWGDLGFDAPPDQQAAAAAAASNEGGMVVAQPGGENKDNGELPPGGEYYDARIFTPTLGVMFFKPQELTDSLFLNTDRDVVDALGERPVVAFIVEGSSARSAGVELGHVLLKVNGVDVTNPKDASRLIKEGPRPLPLLFYVPNTEIVVAEGEHMVKYDTRETTAPNSAKDWKPKYVVIGGIIAQPWMINMYRSKSEYDIAVIETQARRPVSVKVKQFSLQGARIQNDWQGPQMVKYKNKLHPWKYIVVLPVARNPIKISSPNLASLKPVHEGIRRVLLAQQRSGRGGGNPHSAAPVQDQGYQGHQDNDQYGGGGGGGGGGPPPQSYAQQAPPQNYGAPPQNYGQPPPQAYGQTAYGGY